MSNRKLEDLVALARAAAAEAANFQERFAAEDTEARKIVDIMEHYLRDHGSVVYGGAAINAHMSPEHKFYDPRLYLPDYDFMTPDPLQDCANLITAFQREGFEDVEAKFGIHEGTYKIFVNYRAAADITYVPPELYKRIQKDATKIDGIYYASPNFLRMNIYLELSRPAGMVSRWEKVYERLLLLNEDHPIKAGRCVVSPLKSLGAKRAATEPSVLHDRIVGIGIAANAIFLSGASYLVDRPADPEEIVLMMTNKPADLVARLVEAGLDPVSYEPQGELLPGRTELFARKGGALKAVVFETVACHSYTTLKDPVGYRLGSLDFLIQMYYAFHFTELEHYLGVRLLCVIQQLVDLEATIRREAAAEGKPAHDVFPLECVGHQPSMPELKKAHRLRVLEKRAELAAALKGSTARSSGVRLTRKARRMTKG